MASEAILGEERLIDSKYTTKSLRAILGFDNSETKTKKHNTLNSEDNQLRSNQKSRQKRKPFQRNPKRDKVGS
jgi:hypothetical protein